MPRLAKAIFYSYVDKLDIDKKRKMAILLNSKLPQTSRLLSDSQIRKSSAKCLPFLVNNKDKILVDLENAGFNPGRGWIPSFSTNALAKKYWKIPKARIAELYEQKLVNIDLDEITDNNIENFTRTICTN